MEAFVANESSRIDGLDRQKGSVKQDREVDFMVSYEDREPLYRESHSDPVE